METTPFRLIVSLLLFAIVAFGTSTALQQSAAGGPEADPPEADEPRADRTQPLASIRTALDVRELLADDDPWIEEQLAAMTLEEKVAQMISPRVYAHYMSRDSEPFAETLEYVRELGVGGLTFFAGDVHELSTLIRDFQKEAELPLLISADFERGAAMRIRRSTNFPVAMAVGATGDSHLAYRMGLATALEGRAMGVHQNFAPLGDVNNNPDNPVINVRSFGEDPGQVGQLASAYIRGLHDGGMISTGKHFPGHGDTDLDSHVTLPLIRHNRDRLDRIELPPFRRMIDDGVVSIMTAHIAMPELTGEGDLPATLSRRVLTDLLRDDLGFHGLIVTDAMDMQGIDLYYSREEASILAVQAGADMLLLPPDPKRTIDAVVSAVRLGEISEDRIDRSVRRILSAKRAVSLDRERFADQEKVRETVGHHYHRELALTIARRSMTLVRNEGRLFPLRPGERRRVLLLTIADREDQLTAINRYDSPSTAEPAGNYFISNFREHLPRFSTARLDPRSNDQEIDELIRMARQADIVIAHSYVMARDGAGDLELPGKMNEALDRLAELDKPFGVISFGDPYFILRTPEADAYLAAWSSGEPAVEAAVETLFGLSSPTGTLPIVIPGIGTIGDGLSYE